jgi:hypothetical protein
MKKSDFLLLLFAIALIIGMILTAVLRKERGKHGYGAVDGSAIVASSQEPEHTPVEVEVEVEVEG